MMNEVATHDVIQYNFINFTALNLTRRTGCFFKVTVLCLRPSWSSAPAPTEFLVSNVLTEAITITRVETVEKCRAVIMCKVGQLTEPVVVLQSEEGESGGSFGVVRQFGAYWELLAITQWGRKGG